MSKRKDHTFRFTAKQITEAAAGEAKHHDARAAWWNGEFEKAAAEAKTKGVDVRHFQVSGGQRAQIVIDTTLQERINEAERKRSDHQQKAERYKVDAAAYASQPETQDYQLDSDDVMYFRLAGGTRDEDKATAFV